ncbi:MAG: ferredoxin [Ilumatobacter sp.]
MPPRHVDAVIHAAEMCPGECIFIEMDVPVGALTSDGDIAAA